MKEEKSMHGRMQHEMDTAVELRVLDGQQGLEFGRDARGSRDSRTGQQVKEAEGKSGSILFTTGDSTI